MSPVRSKKNGRDEFTTFLPPFCSLLHKSSSHEGWELVGAGASESSAWRGRHGAEFRVAASLGPAGGLAFQTAAGGPAGAEPLLGRVRRSFFPLLFFPPFFGSFFFSPFFSSLFFLFFLGSIGRGSEWDEAVSQPRDSLLTSEFSNQNSPTWVFDSSS